LLEWLGRADGEVPFVGNITEAVMDRREFLKVGAGCAIAGLGAGAGLVADAHTADTAVAHGTGTAAAKRTDSLAIMSAAAEEHRRRLRNIGECERGIGKCLRRHFIGDYLPGQVVYNLGEYPCRKPWDPDEWDERQLDELRSAGVGLVQLHEEWNDSQRLFGADKFTPVNDAGFRRFVKMVHARGMRLIVYASSGFFQRTDPDFRPEWAAGPDLVECYWRYARCSPASAGWRAHLLPRLARILDEYGVDGLYNDLGYWPVYQTASRPTPDEVIAFEESATRDAALEDLLGIIYAEVERRGGLVKMHYFANSVPSFRSRLYDYLWVGESVRDADAMREAVKNHPPYVVPCLDMSRAKISREDDLYLHSIPYMQFPVLLAGRPFTGERATISGIKYPPEEQCFWTRHLRTIWRYHQAHPDGPYSYGWWDSCPGRPEARPTHSKWLKLYRPMVEVGTYAYVELGESDFFKAPPPKGVVASVFANRELYLVLANYSQAEVSVETTRAFTACEKPDSAAGTFWPLRPRSLTILRKSEVRPFPVGGGSER
jgi:hypothetical protein